MSSKKENKGRETAKQIAGISENLLAGIKTIADQAGADTTVLDDKISEIQSTASNIDKHEPPKKLDWIVLAGFVVFMIAMIGAVFGQNIRWLGVAFVIMPIVMLFGLFNNVKNMQPDWEKQGEDAEINWPNKPKSVTRAVGNASHHRQSKLKYWFVIIMVGLGSLFFGAGGLFLLFSDFVADNF